MSARTARAARDAELGEVARARIGTFSIGVWTAGVVMAVLLSVLAFPALVGGVSFARGDEPPALARHPDDMRDTAVEIPLADGVIAAPADGGYIVIPGGSQAFEFAVDAEGLLDVYQQAGTDPHASGDVSLGRYAGSASVVIVGDAEPSLLWVMPSTAPWTATLRTITPMLPTDRLVSGEVPGVVAMPPGPGSARFAYRSEGNFIVHVERFGQTEYLVNEIDAWRGRKYWSGEGPGVIVVEFGDGPWSITFDEDVPTPTPPASPLPAQSPQPSAVPEPTATGAARGTGDEGDERG